MSNWHEMYFEVTEPERKAKWEEQILKMKYFTYGAITGIVLAISVIVIARLLMW